MIKFVHLFGKYYLGISFVGILAFVVQEIPYIVMPIIEPASNPIMDMPNEIKWLEIVQGVFGVLSVIFLILIVRDDVKSFSLETVKEKIFFWATVLMILTNYVGWSLYYLRYQHEWLMVISQFAVVPLYYFFFGLWKRNYLLAGTAIPFFVIHTINGYLSF